MFKYNVRVTFKDTSNASYSNVTNVEAMEDWLMIFDIKNGRVEKLDLSKVATLHIDVVARELH